MKEKKRSLAKKLELIKKKLSDRESFSVADIESILAVKRSTVYWILWDLTRKGYLNKIGKGLYSLQKKEPNIKPVLSSLATRILRIMQETGYQFFISGLDILSVFMEHIPESYPVLLFVNRYSVEEVHDLLSRKQYDTIMLADIKNYQPIRKISSVKELVLLYQSNDFRYSYKGLASFEKAFVDIYYEVTRRNYPLSLQELARIYINMKRRISLDTSRLIRIASRRNIHYDIRYIVERNLISEKAHELADMLGSQN